MLASLSSEGCYICLQQDTFWTPPDADISFPSGLLSFGEKALMGEAEGALGTSDMRGCESRG